MDALHDPAAGAVAEVCPEFLGLFATTADMCREVEIVEQFTDEVVVVGLVQTDALGMLLSGSGTIDGDTLDGLLGELAVIAVGAFDRQAEGDSCGLAHHAALDTELAAIGRVRPRLAASQRAFPIDPSIDSQLQSIPTSSS